MMSNETGVGTCLRRDPLFRRSTGPLAFPHARLRW
jgi:hypothetical protein